MIEYPKRVRIASPTDEDALYSLLHNRLEAANGFGFPHSEAKIREQIQLGTLGKGGFIGIIDEDGKIVASTSVIMTTFWYSDETILQEGWLFVDPNYRDRGYHKDLFTFLKWVKYLMSKNLGKSVPLVSSVWSPTRISVKERLWRRFLGGRKVASTFMVE